MASSAPAEAINQKLVMQGHDFVFSNQSRQRFLRHTVFWATWWFYFSFVYWYNQQVTDVNDRLLSWERSSH
jgi:hypothetical protein